MPLALPLKMSALENTELTPFCVVGNFRELNRNRIRLIEGLTFQGLDSLEVLKLQRNNISKLTDGAFWGLAKMQVL